MRRHMNVYRTRRKPETPRERRQRGIREVYDSTRVDYPEMPEKMLRDWTRERWRRVVGEELYPLDLERALKRRPT